MESGMGSECDRNCFPQLGQPLAVNHENELQEFNIRWWTIILYCNIPIKSFTMVWSHFSMGWQLFLIMTWRFQRQSLSRRPIWTIPTSQNPIQAHHCHCSEWIDAVLNEIKSVWSSHNFESIVAHKYHHWWFINIQHRRQLTQYRGQCNVAWFSIILRCVRIFSTEFRGMISYDIIHVFWPINHNNLTHMKIHFSNKTLWRC